MATEIERKFMVVSDAWKRTASPGVAIRQGYVARTRRGSARVRIAGRVASLTFKTRRQGLQREEFTFLIPLPDAEDMLARLCVLPVIEKLRHLVRHRGMVWQVDVFQGAGRGIVLAEIELDRAEQIFAVPDWVGPEVTHDVRYRNSALAQLYGRALRAASVRQRLQQRERHLDHDQRHDDGLQPQ
jgi:adenylate cyclase